MLGKIPNLPKTREGIELAASIALWGNKMDLSIWWDIWLLTWHGVLSFVWSNLISTPRPADAKDADVDIFSNILASASENLLHDDFGSLSNYCSKLRENGGGNVHLIVDNAGFELITDLAFAQYLVESGIAYCVTFQLKSHVSLQSGFL